MSDLDALKESIATSHEHLQGWMPWAKDLPTDESVSKWIEDSDNTGEIPFLMVLNNTGSIVGACSLMPRVGEGGLEIGYWVDIRYTRRGIATAGSTPEQRSQGKESGKVPVGESRLGYCSAGAYPAPMTSGPVEKASKTRGGIPRVTCHPFLGGELSEDEVWMLTLVASGRTDEEICVQTGYRIGQVRWGIREAMSKLGARNRPHAVARAIALGYLEVRTP